MIPALNKGERPLKTKKTIKVAPNFDGVQRAVQKVKALALDVGFSKIDAFQIELSLSEALNNIVEHGTDATTDDKIVVSIKIDERAFVLQIIDHGKPNQKFGQYDEHFVNTLNHIKERGFGQIIINKLMDDVCYCCNKQSNALTLTKLRPTCGTQASDLKPATQP